MVFFVNGTESFSEWFIQLTAMYLLCGLFDRVHRLVLGRTYESMDNTRNGRSYAIYP